MSLKNYSSVLYSRKVNDSTYLLVLKGLVISTFTSQKACDDFVAKFMR